MKKSNTQIVIDYIKKCKGDFTQPMLAQRLKTGKGPTSWAIKELQQSGMIEATGELSQTSAVYYRLTEKNKQGKPVDYMKLFAYGGNPETVKANLHY